MENEMGGANAGAAIGVLFFYLIVYLFVCFTLSKLLAKANMGSTVGAFIPIYNIVLWMQLAGKPGWWTILMFIPIVNWIIPILVNLALAEKFGKSAGYGIGLWILGIVFYPMLAFGDSQYQGEPGAALAQA